MLLLSRVYHLAKRVYSNRRRQLTSIGYADSETDDRFAHGFRVAAGLGLNCDNEPPVGPEIHFNHNPAQQLSASRQTACLSKGNRQSEILYAR